MVEIRCLYCDENFTVDNFSLTGIVKCSNCKKTMHVSIVGEILQKIEWDPIQIEKDKKASI